MSLLLRSPNIGAYALFLALSVLTDGHTVVNYVEVMQLLGTSSCISPNVTPHEGLVQVRQSCAEATILRRIGAVPMLYLVWLEGVKGVRPLTQESDGLLTRLRQSYKEQLRRMSTPPTTLTLNVTLSERRSRVVLALLDDLECCVPRELQICWLTLDCAQQTGVSLLQKS